MSQPPLPSSSSPSAAALRAQLDLIRRLVRDHEMTDYGLQARRLWLRHESTVALADRLELASERSEVLDRVCRRLIANISGRRKFFVDRGDLRADLLDDQADAQPPPADDDDDDDDDLDELDES